MVCVLPGNLTSPNNHKCILSLNFSIFASNLSDEAQSYNCFTRTKLCLYFIPLVAVDCHGIQDKQKLAKAVEDIGDWETLCENLGVPKRVLSGLNNMIDTYYEKKKQLCLKAYLDTDRACWEQVVKVVADYPFYKIRLSKEIARKHGIDYSSIVKDEV